MRKLYTDVEYSEKAIQANEQNKKLIKVQREIEEPFEVYEYEKKTIQVPIYDEETGEIIGYEEVEVDDLDKPIMIEEIDTETGEIILVHKHHTEYRTVIVEELEIVDFSEEEKQEMISKLSLTKREVFLALYKDKGVTAEQIRGQIQSTEALIEFDYAEKYYRGNPLINGIGALLGYTPEQLDYLFIHKEFEEE